MLINTPANEDAGTRQIRNASSNTRVERNSFMGILQTLSWGVLAAGGVLAGAGGQLIVVTVLCLASFVDHCEKHSGLTNVSNPGCIAKLPTGSQRCVRIYK